MTREERAITNLKQMCSDGRYLGSGSYAPLEVLEDFAVAIKSLDQLDKIKQIVKECQDNKLFTGDAVFEICEVLKND